MASYYICRGKEKAWGQLSRLSNQLSCQYQRKVLHHPPLRCSSRIRQQLVYTVASRSFSTRTNLIRSLYDESDNWRDWFESPEYRNAWSDDIGPLDGAPVLDTQSRMVLDLLNKLYQVGLTKSADRVTTGRVHAIMQQLEDMPEKSSNSMWQRAERARFLLEAMELFEEFRGVTGLPVAVPLPTHETYWRVLRMYSSKYLHAGLAAKKVPQICHAIVKRMQDSGRLELQPTVVHWNQVLSALANSTDEERPLQAARLLYELDAKGCTDASSFSHALRACSALAARHQKATPKFIELAIPVAQRIWVGLKNADTVETQTYHYTHMLRVFRNEEDEAKRDENAVKIFGEAAESKRVNIHVLNEFLQVASQSAVQQLLGKPNYSKDPLVLIREIPPEWIEIVEPGGKSPYEW